MGHNTEESQSKQIRTGVTMRFFELLKESNEITDQDLQRLEVYADRLFASLGIDVEFTRHFKDRVNDTRNQKPITMAELTRLFKQEYKKHGKQIAQMGPDAEAVMKDMRTDINVPFALQWDGKELDLIAKTVMRKPNFSTPNPEFRVEHGLVPMYHTMKAYKMTKARHPDGSAYFKSDYPRYEGDK